MIVVKPIFKEGRLKILCIWGYVKNGLVHTAVCLLLYSTLRNGLDVFWNHSSNVKLLHYGLFVNGNRIEFMKYLCFYSRIKVKI